MQSESHHESEDEYDGTYAHQKAESESEDELMIEVSSNLIMFNLVAAF
jgi:hypothetical protein